MQDKNRWTYCPGRARQSQPGRGERRAWSLTPDSPPAIHQRSSHGCWKAHKLKNWSFFFFFNWSIVDLQCYVSFWYTAKWFSCVYIFIYIHIYIYILFQILFPCGVLQDIDYSSLCYTVGPCCFYLFIYLFMAVLGLRFCARAFSSCGKWGPLFIVVRGPLTIAASLVPEHRLQTRRLSSCGSRA